MEKKINFDHVWEERKVRCEFCTAYLQILIYILVYKGYK